MLASCVGSRVAVRPDLPPMPAVIQTPCRQPEITATDARVIIGRYIAAVRTCDGKRADAVSFYSDLRTGLQAHP
jgi:hypothetical protein